MRHHRAPRDDHRHHPCHEPKPHCQPLPVHAINLIPTYFLHLVYIPELNAVKRHGTNAVKGRESLMQFTTITSENDQIASALGLLSPYSEGLPKNRDNLSRV